MSTVMQKIKVIELFAGIGGFRIPLQELGGKCVFSSEFNHHAQRSYELNFGEVPFGDITKLNINIVPKHNVLCAGFPCQPFSQAGYKKGFSEKLEDRGNMFFVIRDIIAEKRPDAIFLENVRHLIQKATKW